MNGLGKMFLHSIDEKVFEEKVQQPIIQKEHLAEWFDAYTGGER